MKKTSYNKKSFIYKGIVSKEKICTNCGEKYDFKSSLKKYCSKKCRNAVFKTENSNYGVKILNLWIENTCKSLEVAR